MIDEKVINAHTASEVQSPPPAYTPLDGIQGDDQGQSSTGYPPSPASRSPTHPVQASASRNVSQPYQQPMSDQQPPPTQVMSEAALGQQYQAQLLARCAHGDHDVSTKHGAMGIICAIFLFPIGLACLLLDVERKCNRCGVRLE